MKQEIDEVALKRRLLELRLDMVVRDFIPESTLKQALMESTSYESYYWVWK